MKPGEQAHDRWVCVPCRWSSKIPLRDVRNPNRPSYRCPQCRRQMIWTGTAFRPPRRTDDDAWAAVAGVLAAGVRYLTSGPHQQLPRTRTELTAWLAEPARAWLPEKAIRITQDATGRVVETRLGGRVLVHGQPVLCHRDGQWLQGELMLRGSGGPLFRPVVRFPSAGPVPVEESTRLRRLADPNS